MDWILSHLGIVIFLAAGLAGYINQLRKTKEIQPSSEVSPPRPAGRRVTSDRPPSIPGDVDERTRRIQEEIRRKIQERRGAGPLPTLTRREPPPLRPREPVDVPRPPEGEFFPAELPKFDGEVLERQRKLAAQLSELEDQRRQAQLKAARVVVAPIRESTRPQAEEIDLITELRDSGGIRRAILLREILGTPVGLK